MTIREIIQFSDLTLMDKRKWGYTNQRLEISKLQRFELETTSNGGLKAFEPSFNKLKRESDEFVQVTKEYSLELRIILAIFNKISINKLIVLVPMNIHLLKHCILCLGENGYAVYAGEELVAGSYPTSFLKEVRISNAYIYTNPDAPIETDEDEDW